MKAHERFRNFEKVYQAASWLGTFVLVVIVLRYPGITPSSKPLLLLISALFGIASLLFANLLPIEGKGLLKYRPEDKVLVESFVIILLLTAFLYTTPLSQAGFFLFLIPILIEAMVLHERIIAAEAAFSAVAIVFLRLSYSAPFDFEFLLAVGIFLSIIVLMYVLTRQLRVSGERNDELSEHLSERLDQIQVISMLVQESKNFSRFGYLIGRIGEITADAFDAEQCGFFLKDADGNVALHEGSVGFEEHDRALYALEKNLSACRSVLSEGRTLFVNGGDDAEEEHVTGLIGDRHLKNFMMVPMNINESRIGVVMVANKRGESFMKTDLHFLVLLAGFIATLIDSADAFRRVEAERLSARRLTRLLVGRELKMKELKSRLKENGL